MRPARTWDIFCTVIDNYGDIGVCWRLAQQLVAEHGQQVRLWVDDLASFQRLCPDINPLLAQQSCRGVEVRHWTQPFPKTEPADMVVEAFACELPPEYLAAMAAALPPASKPLPSPMPTPIGRGGIGRGWINLEYLTAEPWAIACHKMPSPHPNLPLTKYFFFPGFSQGTGGLPLEHDLLRKCAAFQHEASAQAAFWGTLGLPMPTAGELRISVFCYGGQHVDGLFDAWAAGKKTVTCLVADGPVLKQVTDYFHLPAMQTGDHAHRGNLTVQILPFLEQDNYDRLLWACDCNFVRGEDSFVRAQWAAKPMVWQAYPQQDAAHLAKLQAFLDLYCAGLPEAAAESLRACWLAWNSSSLEARHWLDFWRHWKLLQTHAQCWTGKMAKLGSLSFNLTQFMQD